MDSNEKLTEILTEQFSKQLDCIKTILQRNNEALLLGVEQVVEKSVGRALDKNMKKDACLPVAVVQSPSAVVPSPSAVVPSPSAVVPSPAALVLVDPLVLIDPFADTSQRE